MLYFIISSYLHSAIFSVSIWTFIIPLFSLCPFGHYVYVSAIFFLSTWTILYFYAKTLIIHKNLKKHLRLSFGLLVTIPSILEIRTYGLSASGPLFCYYSVINLSIWHWIVVCLCM